MYSSRTKQLNAERWTQSQECMASVRSCRGDCIEEDTINTDIQLLEAVNDVIHLPIVIILTV